MAHMYGCCKRLQAQSISVVIRAPLCHHARARARPGWSLGEVGPLMVWTGIYRYWTYVVSRGPLRNGRGWFLPLCLVTRSASRPEALGPAVQSDRTENPRLRFQFHGPGVYRDPGGIFGARAKNYASPGKANSSCCHVGSLGDDSATSVRLWGICPFLWGLSLGLGPFCCITDSWIPFPALRPARFARWRSSAKPKATRSVRQSDRCQVLGGHRGRTWHRPHRRKSVAERPGVQCCPCRLFGCFQANTKRKPAI